ncbi:hypothetical protein J7E81_09680 [Bacillus sp. ISL-18]|uniref:hypothetical protein n=1 Tax=Bacillus sp. ISL-18 TaxID=2819118 RepID=UPI001BEA3F2F|nr:hypothetical protein [Bacillus sp. ISL-18]MBT2655498.1 hypothetical protein [Bacillus sp. ISL-18]
MEGRVSVVTGSSQGIGKAVVIYFQQAGATVLVTGTKSGTYEESHRGSGPINWAINRLLYW